MNKWSRPTMAPDKPLITVAAALAVLLGLLLMSARPPGTIEADTAGHDASDGTPEEDLPPAEGEPDGQTVVAPDAVPGLQEEELSYDGSLDTSVSYPVLPDADPLSEHLESELGAVVAAFDDANPGAESYEAGWNLTAARDDLVGVRVVATETDSEGGHETHTTYWYDAAEGLVYNSTHLFDGREALSAFNTLVREQVGDEADASGLYPITVLYDSVGFNPDGDLVVEFDSGQVAPEGEGRVHAVLDHGKVEPLLSELGTRAREAATVGVDTFAVSEVPEPEAQEAVGADPGAVSPVDESIDCDDPDTECVALTYDDGPGGGTTDLLDTLAEHEARATFFVTGHPVQEHPDVVRRTYAEGHEIANHTLDHPDMTTLGSDKGRDNLGATQALVLRETGYEMDIMRPPYGATDDGVADLTEQMGLSQIMWSVDTDDWRDRDAGKVADKALDGAEDGAIILMHDIHSSTVTGSEEIIRELDERGVEMVTVTQLLGPTTPGESYSDWDDRDHKDEDGSEDDGDEDDDPVEDAAAGEA